MSNQNQNQPLHNSESLLNALIGLAIRKHNERCEMAQDSRLRCTCGADLHNAKVQGSAIGLRKAMYEEMMPNSKPKKAESTPPTLTTIPTTGTRMEEEKKPAVPKFETGTSIPGIQGNIPFAPQQPVHDNPNAGAPSSPSSPPPAEEKTPARAKKQLQ